MLVAVLFFLLSLAGALGLPLLGQFSLWWAPALFAGLELLLHLLLLLGFWLACPHRRDREQPLERQSPAARWVIAQGARALCCYGGMRLRIIGEDKLPAEPFLLVANHRSLFDPLLVMGYLPHRNVAFVSKPENLRIPLVGDIADAAGYLSLNRDNDREALKTILRAAEQLKRGLCSIGIYPEGTRNRGEGLLPFHAGSFKIAQRAGAPLVIAVTRGTERLHRRLFLLPTRVELEILEVIPAEQVKATPTRDLAERSRQRMLAALEA